MGKWIGFTQDCRVLDITGRTVDLPRGTLMEVNEETFLELRRTLPTQTLALSPAVIPQLVRSLYSPELDAPVSSIVYIPCSTCLGSPAAEDAVTVCPSCAGKGYRFFPIALRPAPAGLWAGVTR